MKLNHMKDLTAKWIEIATKLNHKPVLRCLSSGDVASNKLCYNNKCYDTIQYEYSKFTISILIKVGVCVIQNAHR